MPTPQAAKMRRIEDMLESGKSTACLCVLHSKSHVMKVTSKYGEQLEYVHHAFRSIAKISSTSEK